MTTAENSTSFASGVLAPSPDSPAALGYRMSAEWEAHAGTWLSWPHKLASWPGKFEPIPPLYARLVRTLAAVEHVHVLCGGHPHAQAKVLVGDIPNVTLHQIPTDDAWVRDSGPTFLCGPKDSPAALIDWGYNAWGGKYPPYDHDDVIPRLIAKELGRVCYEPGIILEGGRDRNRRPGHFADHRSLPAEPQSKSATFASRRTSSISPTT